MSSVIQHTCYGWKLVCLLQLLNFRGEDPLAFQDITDISYDKYIFLPSKMCFPLYNTYNIVVSLANASQIYIKIYSIEKLSI